jgi:hypothetical protein
MMVRLGQVERSVGQTRLGCANIDEGLSLYNQVANVLDRAHSGWRALHRALTAGNAAEAEHHSVEARQIWASIGRLDPVHDWLSTSSN